MFLVVGSWYDVIILLPMYDKCSTPSGRFLAVIIPWLWSDLHNESHDNTVTYVHIEIPYFGQPRKHLNELTVSTRSEKPMGDSGRESNLKI